MDFYLPDASLHAIMAYNYTVYFTMQNQWLAINNQSHGGCFIVRLYGIPHRHSVSFGFKG